MSRPGRTTTYEWKLESWDEHHDIVDCNHADTLLEAVGVYVKQVPEGLLPVLCLVRDVHEDDGDLLDRQHAYLNAEGYLEEQMDDGARVPQRFLDMVRKHGPFPHLAMPEPLPEDAP